MDLRRRILAAATAEFLAKGFSEARTRVIARRAETSESSLFRLFDSKYALLAAVLGDGWTQLASVVLPEARRVRPASAALSKLASGTLRFYSENPDLGTLLLSESWIMGPASIATNKDTAAAFLSTPTREFVAAIDEIIATGQKQGELLNTLSATAIREAFFGLFEGLAFGWHLAAHAEYQASYTLQEAEEVLRAFLQGLTKEKS